MAFVQSPHLPHGRSSSLSRRDFLRLGALLASGSVIPPSLMALAGSFHQDGRMAVMPGSETAQELVNLAATAEALAVTFYYRGVTAPGGFFTRLPNDWQTDLRAALDLDIKWVLSLKGPAFPGDYVQSINILYESHEPQRADEQIIIETQFFQVGRLFAGAEYFLPVVVRN